MDPKIIIAHFFLRQYITMLISRGPNANKLTSNRTKTNVLNLMKHVNLDHQDIEVIYSELIRTTGLERHEDIKFVVEELERTLVEHEIMDKWEIMDFIYDEMDLRLIGILQGLIIKNRELISVMDEIFRKKMLESVMA